MQSLIYKRPKSRFFFLCNLYILTIKTYFSIQKYNLKYEYNDLKLCIIVMELKLKTFYFISIIMKICNRKEGSTKTYEVYIKSRKN